MSMKKLLATNPIRYIICFTFLSFFLSIELSMKNLLANGASISIKLIVNMIVNIIVTILILASWYRFKQRKIFSTYLQAFGRSCEVCVQDYFYHPSDEIDEPKERLDIREGCLASLQARPEDEERIMYIHVGSWLTHNFFEPSSEEYARIRESIYNLACRMESMLDARSSNQISGIYKMPLTHLGLAMSGLLKELGDSLENSHLFNREASFNKVVEALKEIAFAGQMLEDPTHAHTHGEPELGFEGRRTFNVIIQELGLRDLHFREVFPGDLLNALTRLDPVILAVEEFGTKSGYRIATLPRL